MPVFNADTVRAYAVEVVNEFIQGTPLSDAIAALATKNAFNANQISRLVEVSNQLAYLKLQSMSEDRTFEFKVADYHEVLKQVFDNNEPEMAKAAMDKSKTISPMEIMTRPGTVGRDLTKLASENHDSYDMDPQMRAVLIHKAIIRGNHELEKLASDSQSMVYQISDAVDNLLKQPDCFEKMASMVEVDDNKKYISFMLKMAGHSITSLEGVSGLLFTEKDQRDILSAINLVKQAQSMLVHKNNLEINLGKARDALNVLLEKKAFIGMAANVVLGSKKKDIASSASKIIDNAVSAPVAAGVIGAAKAVGTAAKVTGKTAARVAASGKSVSGIGGVVDTPSVNLKNQIM